MWASGFPTRFPAFFWLCASFSSSCRCKGYLTTPIELLLALNAHSFCQCSVHMWRSFPAFFWLYTHPFPLHKLHWQRIYQPPLHCNYKQRLPTVHNERMWFDQIRRRPEWFYMQYFTHTEFMNLCVHTPLLISSDYLLYIMNGCGFIKFEIRPEWFFMQYFTHIQYMHKTWTHVCAHCGLAAA